MFLNKEARKRLLQSHDMKEKIKKMIRSLVVKTVYYLDTDETSAFSLKLLKNYIFIAHNEDAIFIFLV